LLKTKLEKRSRGSFFVLSECVTGSCFRCMLTLCGMISTALDST
jgi:hypothetical protein